MAFDDLDTSRSWVVLMSCFLSLLVNGGTNYSVGLIHRAFLERYGRSNAATSWAGSLHSALFSLASPMSSVLVDKGSCRVAMVTSGVLFTVGYFSTAFAPTLEVAIVTCSISGLGGAAGYAASIVALGFYFERFRNFAQGFALSGIGVGLFVLSPVMQASREAYGMTGFFLVLASTSMQVIVCGVLVKPSKLERCTQFRRKGRSTPETEAKAVCTCTLFKTYFEVLTTKPITFLSLGMFLFHFGTYIVFLNIPNYCVHKGFSDIQASFLLSVCGIASVVCRLLTGIVANSEGVDEILLYSGSMGVLALSTCLFPLFSQFYSGHMIYAVILGMYFGNPYVLISTINTQYVGISNMAAAVGLELCFGGFGALTGPLFTGFLLDHGVTYEQIFVIGGLTLLLAALCSLVSTVFPRQISKQALEPNIKSTQEGVNVHENKADEKAGDNEENQISKDPG